MRHPHFVENKVRTPWDPFIKAEGHDFCCLHINFDMTKNVYMEGDEQGECNWLAVRRDLLVKLPIV